MILPEGVTAEDVERDLKPRQSLWHCYGCGWEADMSSVGFTDICYCPACGDGKMTRQCSVTANVNARLPDDPEADGTDAAHPAWKEGK